MIEKMNRETKVRFGLFLNYAEHNIVIVLQFIHDILLKQWKKCIDVDSSKPFESDLLQRLEYTDFQQMEQTLSLINKHFPFLGKMIDSNKLDNLSLEGKAKRASENLILLLKAVHELRNQCSHESYDLTGEETLLSKDDIETIRYRLNRVFDASVDEAKRRFFAPDKTDDEIEKDLNHLRRYISVNKKREDNPAFKYRIVENEELTINGIAYITSLFLEKREAYLLLNSLSGFKENRTDWSRLTKECYTVYRMQLPRSQVTSNYGKEGLLLEMVSELIKCPHEIFKHLSEEERNRFEPNLQNDASDSEDENENVLKRYNDRFTYLALRYIDDNNLFENIRFQIDLGRYYKESYDKTTISGERVNRNLTKRLTTFGRLKEVKDIVVKDWNDITKSTTDNPVPPYRTDTVPHYHIVNNQIALKINETGLPNLSESIKLSTPDAWISAYDLPGLIYIGIISNDFKSLENKIIGYIKQTWKKFASVADGEKDLDDISLPLKHTLKALNNNNEILFRKKKHAQIFEETENLLKSYDNRVEKLQDRKTKPKDKKKYQIRAGILADYLAKDMVKMQPYSPEKQGKDKITSINFRSLQSNLAFFGSSKDSLKEVFQRAGLIARVNQHPFLSKINPSDYSAIGPFYKKYLLSKIEFLEKCQRNDDYSHVTFKPTRNKYSDSRGSIKEVAERLSHSPVNINSEFFLNLLKQELPSITNERMNLSWLIKKHYNKQGFELQDIYSKPKSYELHKKVGNYISKNKGIRRQLEEISNCNNCFEARKLVKALPELEYNPPTLKQTLLKLCQDFNKNEKLIRFRELQDIVMITMVNELIKEIMTNPEDEFKPIRLESLTPENTDPLNNPIDTTLSICLEEVKKKKKDKANYVIKQFEIKNVKIKNLGKYKRYQHDKRLIGLTSWMGQEPYNFDTVIKELEDFDRYKIEIALKLNEFEKEMLKKYDGFKATKGNGCRFVGFKEYTDKYKKEFDKENAELLKDIRNRIYHNAFPNKTILNNLTIHNEIAMEIKDFVIDLVDKMLKKLKEKEE